MTTRNATADDRTKTVSWKIENAHIEDGVENPQKNQAIFYIVGKITRSDSTTGPAKGTKYVWSPNRKAAGFKLDLTNFDRTVDPPTGTIVVTGTVKKNGRTKNKPVSDLSKYADLV